MKDINNLKILVFTVDCWSKAVGANTMSSLFSWCKPENLANVYIRPEMPTFEGCGAYFQITENDVIKSIVKKNVSTGRKVSANQTESETQVEIQNNRYNKFRKHRPYSLLLAREVLWKMGKWHSPEFDKFLLDFAPDVIVFAYEGLLHFNRLVRHAVNLTGAKAVGYFWDDNFTYKQLPGNIGYYIYRYFQRKSIQKTVALSNQNFAITPKTKRECDAFFGIDCTLLTKPMETALPAFCKYEVDFPINILYTGNLGIGRLDTLALISKALDKVNCQKQYFILDVYTNSFLTDKDKNKFGSSVVFHKPLPQDEIVKVQKQADILLFAEDIAGKNAKIARLSFSTKLTDYFAAGKCIFAVANADIAPVEYLAENNAALVASTVDEIENALNCIIQDKSVISQFAESAYNLGKSKHNYDNVIHTLKNTLTMVLSEQNESTTN